MLDYGDTQKYPVSELSYLDPQFLTLPYQVGHLLFSCTLFCLRCKMFHLLSHLILGNSNVAVLRNVNSQSGKNRGGIAVYRGRSRLKIKKLINQYFINLTI